MKNRRSEIYLEVIPGFMGEMLYLLRYSEVALKSHRVRNRFLSAMISHLEDLLVADGIEAGITSEWGRIFLRGPASASYAIRRCFGVVSYSPVERCEASVPIIARKATELAGQLIHEGMSFAIRARRTGTHTFTSQVIAVESGRAILEALDPDGDGTIRVDLGKPDIEIFIEVRQKDAYLFTERFPGPGGLPFGTQGTVWARLSTRDDALAAYLLMKRGCLVKVVLDDEISSDAEEYIHILKRFDPHLRPVHSSEAMRDPEHRPVVVGWRYRDLVKNMDNLNRKGVLLTPLVGFDDEMIEELDRSVRALSGFADGISPTGAC